MKRFTTFTFILLTSFTTFATNGENPTPGETTKQEKLESLEARVYEGSVYFNLTVSNENESGWYSLVKVYNSGEFESVGIKRGVKNDIDKPLLYSFVDENSPKEDVTYQLIEIRHSSSIILSEWRFDANNGQIETQMVTDVHGELPPHKGGI